VDGPNWMYQSSKSLMSAWRNSVLLCFAFISTSLHMRTGERKSESILSWDDWISTQENGTCLDSQNE
jgi:hypothetical protein